MLFVIRLKVLSANSFQDRNKFNPSSSGYQSICASWFLILAKFPLKKFGYSDFVYLLTFLLYSSITKWLLFSSQGRKFMSVAISSSFVKR